MSCVPSIKPMIHSYKQIYKQVISSSMVRTYVQFTNPSPNINFAK